MHDRWLYRSSGEEFGPVPFEVIAELARSGLISPEDEVCREGAGWHAAGEIVGLFEETVSSESLSSGSTLASALDSQFDDILQSAPAVELSFDAAFDDVLRFAPAIDRRDGSSRRGRSRIDAPTAAREFYCRIAGVEFGPLPLSALQHWAALGRLSGEDELRSTAADDWVAATNVAELKFHQTAYAPNGSQAPRTGADRDLVESLIDEVLIEPPAAGIGIKSETKEFGALAERSIEMPSPRPASDRGSARPALASLMRTLEKPQSEKKSRTARRTTRTPAIGLPSSPLLYTLVALVVVLAVVKLWPEAGGSVRGRVLVDGKPVPVGSISFRPADSTAGPSFTAALVNGSYAVADRVELGTHQYQVIVTIGSPLGEPPPEIADDPTFAPLNGGRFKQTIVAQGQSENTFDFSLSTADAQWPAEGEGPAGQEIHRLK